MKNDINIIFVNEKHSPSYQINEIYRTHNQTERFNNQLNWTSNKKDKCWDKIVKNKIAMQEELIERLFNEKKAYSNYIKKVKKGDIYNCEAFVQRKYFLKLFGNKFVRHNEDDINYALNYGFANYKAHKVFSKGQIIHQYEFNNSADGQTSLIVPNDVYIIIPKGYDTAKFEMSININQDLKAPIASNQVVGEIIIKTEDGNYITNEVVVLDEVEQLTWWKIVVRTLRQLIIT